MTDLQKVEQEQMKRIYQLPATYCNKYYLTANPSGGIRVGFAEGVPGTTEDIIRFNLMMSVSDAESLQRLLATFIEQLKANQLPFKPETVN